MTEPREAERDPRPSSAPRPDDAADADVAEQAADLRAEEDDENGWPQTVPFDVNEADAAEQTRSVRLDEDDYR